MRKLWYLISLAFCALLFAACGGVETISFTRETLEDGGPSLPGAEPRSTLEEVREGGFPLLDEIMSQYEIGEEKLESVSYRLDSDKAVLTVAGYKTHYCLFQFVEGQLTSIQAYFTEQDASEKVSEELTRLYGDPVVNETAAGRLERWNLEGEQAVQLGVLHGTNHPGNFQLAYPWFVPEGELEP